jgi:hypothetical protein
MYVHTHFINNFITCLSVVDQRNHQICNVYLCFQKSMSCYAGFEIQNDWTAAHPHA